jgi:hypothetical protein
MPLQKWLITIVIALSVLALGVFIYSYERYHRGPREAALFGTWQDDDPDLRGWSYYRFNADRTYEVLFGPNKSVDEKGIWYAGGDFVYLGRPFEWASFGAVTIWRIDELSPTELRFRYNPNGTVFTYKRVE